ncbi:MULTISPECIES: DUF4058 family protein [Aerosakkonema]|uniref:DUF4058 family protein n=1 Tax=Aerosakkonema TaxID=1246629 RepID=UPI0035B89717
MPSTFPGMNPYLENPDFWPGVHHLLIGELLRFLAPQLRPKYIVAVEVRMYETGGEDLLVGIPDVVVQSPLTETNPATTNVAVAAPPAQPVTVTIPVPEIRKQGYLEIREVETKEVVTAIEILSPVNKRSGEGRKAYEAKRQKVLGSLTNLVEIDLLRSGQAMPFFSNGIQSQYRILVCRSAKRPLADLYAFNLQNEIPKFPIPLQSGDVEPVVDLQALLNSVYDVAGYDMRIDYRREAVPPLSESDAVWADALLREQGLR